MKKKILTVLLLLIMTYSYSQDRKRFDWGVMANYTIYPGVRIFPEEGVDIMKSRVSGAWFFGISLQLNSRNNRNSSEFNIVGGLEPSLKTLTIDWDKLGTVVDNASMASESLFMYSEKQPILFFNYSYKHYLSVRENSFYLHFGLQLIAPDGINDVNKFDGFIYENDSLEVVYILENRQKHNIPYRPFYFGYSFGLGYRAETKFFSFDYKLKFNHFQSYYYGVYETYPDMDFYAYGSYIQKNYSLELGVCIYFKSLKKKVK